MKKFILAVCALLMTALLICGCGGAKDSAAKNDGAEKIVLQYTDELKKLGFTEPLILNKKPQRVVSLAHTPVLALEEMGITQIGIPANKMFPWKDELKQSAKEFNVAMNDNFDIETVVALEPDLVIAGYHAKESYGKLLEKERIPVYYVDAGHVVTYQSVKILTYALMDAFGSDNAGAAAIRERFEKLEARMAAKRAQNENKKVMVLMSAPPRHFIQTKDGTLGNLAQLLGYRNVYENTKSSMVLLDKEQALSYEPDLLLSVGAAPTAALQQQLMEDDFAKNPEYWQQLKAIRDKKVVYLPMKYVASAGINIIDLMNELIDTLEERNL